MKNTAITTIFQFLEDHIALILGLFFPAWYGIFIVLAAVLQQLPSEIARKLEPQVMDVAFVILGSLVFFAVIAIRRMTRDIKAGNLRRPVIYLLALDTIILLCFFPTFEAAQLKSDNALTTGNLVRISRRLEAYKEEHGGYPPPQDMKSLLDTLGIGKSDLRKTFFFDVYSAEYHAPAEDSNDPEDRLVTMHTKWHLFEGYDHLLFLRRDGSVGTEYLKDKNQPPGTKQENNRSAAIPDSE